MLKHNLHYAEFYITNVCNLACDNCNRYNNFAFSGHDTWKDWAEQYQKWSQRLNLIDIGILGGEPMLNPDFINWVHGITELGPHSYIKIITNGTQFHRWPNLHQELAKYHGQVSIEVTEHDIDRTQHTKQMLLDFLDQPTTEFDVYNDFLWRIQYNQQRQSTWPECRTVRQFLSWPSHLQDQIGLDPKDFYLGKNSSANVWQDIHGIKVILSTARTFQGSAVKYDPETQTLKLRNSRPEDAIQVCTFKPCHHFIRGQLYKCGPVGILPEFVQQFPVEMTDQERQILHSYVPARADWDQQQLEQFILGLKNADPIAQCRFCPDHVTIRDGGPTTNAYRKKIKIKAI